MSSLLMIFLTSFIACGDKDEDTAVEVVEETSEETEETSEPSSETSEPSQEDTGTSTQDTGVQQ